MAEKRRPLYFSYDPNSPADIHVMFSPSSRENHRWPASLGWVKPNSADVARMVGNGLCSALVVHTSGSRDGNRPRLDVGPETQMVQMLDIVRQMGCPRPPTKPKVEMQVPFDADGNQLHRGPQQDRWNPDKMNGPSNVVWKPNHTFLATMTFDKFFNMGAAADYIRLHDERGRTYGMFLRELEKAIHNIDHGRLSGKFTFCKIGISYGVRFLETQDEFEDNLAAGGDETGVTW